MGMVMTRKAVRSIFLIPISTLILGLILALIPILIPDLAEGGQMEISGSFSFNQNNYGPASSQWSRKWSASVGYSFWDGFEEVEFSITDAFFRAQIAGFEDTSYHDQVYSIDFVQAFTSKSSYIQPYIKLGVGQLNRTATGSFAGGGAPPAEYDSLTGVLGAGIKVFLTKRVGVKAEGTTYLAGGVLSTWQDNFSVYFGLSLYL
jgi:hypothetical protein